MNKLKNQFLILFLGLKFLLQFSLVHPIYELHRDEYLHLDQAEHLAWGYRSVPPFTSWISWIIALLGNGEFWIRFFPALFGALTLWLVWKMAEVLGGGLYALILSALAVLFSVLLRLNILYQPNAADILFWAALYYFLIQYAHTERPVWLYAAAIAFAFGFLNKYNIVFALIGLLPALTITPERKVFTNKHLYLAGLTAFVLILPNLIWQYKHHFPVIHHMDELARTQLVNIERVGFVRDQLLYFVGALPVLLGAFIAFFRYRPFRPYRFMFWAYFITIAIFIVFRAKSYYAIGLYPPLLAFGAVYWEHLLKEGKKRYLKFVLAAIPVLFTVLIWDVAFPVLTPEAIRRQPEKFQAFGMLRWEDGQDHALPQDFADMLGWRELAAKVDSAWLALADPEHTFVYCDNYGETGAINYYTKHKNLRAHSFSADYIDWIELKQPVKNLILIKEIEEDDIEEEKLLFESSELFGQIENLYAREYGTRIYVLRGARVDINALLNQEIAEKNAD